jgi:hypothetical protein
MGPAVRRSVWARPAGGNDSRIAVQTLRCVLPLCDLRNDRLGQRVARFCTDERAPVGCDCRSGWRLRKWQQMPRVSRAGFRGSSTNVCGHVRGGSAHDRRGRLCGRCSRGRGGRIGRRRRRRRRCGRSDRARSRLNGRRGLGDRGRRSWLRGADALGSRNRDCVDARRRRRRNTRRQQGQRIDVPLRIARHARAEVDVGLRQVDHAARPDRPDDRAFSHERPAHHCDRPEVDERGGVAERRLDRQRLTPGRHRSRERNDSLRRGEHRAAARSAEIDAAMLAARIRVRVVERKRPQHRTVDGPGPGAGAGDRERTRTNDQDRKSPHSSSLLPSLRTTRP